MESLGSLFGLLIGVTLGSLIGAIILRAAAKWVLKEDIAFGNAYLTALMCYLLSVGLSIVILPIAAASGSLLAANIMTILSIPVNFLIQSSIISARLKTSFGKACLVSLMMLAIVIGIFIIVTGIVFLTAPLYR